MDCWAAQHREWVADVAVAVKFLFDCSAINCGKWQFYRSQGSRFPGQVMLHSFLKRGKERGCELLCWFKMNMGFFFSPGVVTVLWREQIRLSSFFKKYNRQKMSTGTSMFLWLQDCVLFWAVRMINGYDHPVLNLKGKRSTKPKGKQEHVTGLQNPWCLGPGSNFRPPCWSWTTLK